MPPAKCGAFTDEPEIGCTCPGSTFTEIERTLDRTVKSRDGFGVYIVIGTCDRCGERHIWREEAFPNAQWRLF